MRRAALVLAVTAAATTVAPADAVSGTDDWGDAAVVFARDGALWRTDPKGKGPAVEVATLPGPATDVRAIRSDATGSVVLVHIGDAWWWGRLDTGVATLDKLTCADAPARLTPDGRCVVCEDDTGNALLIGLVTGRTVRTRVPGAGARIAPLDGVRHLLWADGDGVWAAPLRALRERRAVAPVAPKRGFLAAPDGLRAVAVYDGTVFEKKQRVPAEVLDGFALDGTAARRMLHRDGVVIDWSWDSAWVLVQAGDSACITRTVGGQYKCWKGYEAVSLAEDGRWALLLGKRPTSDEARDSAEAPDEPPPRSLFRGRLEGAYTERPSLVETVIEGSGALWLPARDDVE